MNRESLRGVFKWHPAEYKPLKNRAIMLYIGINISDVFTCDQLELLSDSKNEMLHLYFFYKKAITTVNNNLCILNTCGGNGPPKNPGASNLGPFLYAII